ncbi:MAG: phospholipid carrier-dependent glycosyltransferase [Angelakisella sp.]
MNKTKNRRVMLVLLLVAFVLRTLFMLLCKGYSNDVSCFVAWSHNLVEYGADGFYTSGFFADYPPGYLYWLWGIGQINKLLGIENASALGQYLMGLLPLFCDIALAWLAWYLTDRNGHPREAILAGAMVAFSPVLLYNVGVWKQVDSVLAVALVVCFLLLDRKQWYAASAVYAISVLIKPQALILGPVLAVGFLLPLLTCKTGKNRLKVLTTTTLSALLCLSIIFAGSLPFRGTQSLLWLPEKYLTTMSYYSYATINAFNFFGALGGNWKPMAEGFLLTYSQWGILFILCATVVMVFLGITAAKKQQENLPLLAALYGLMVFTFAHGMHERYSIPSLVLLLFGWQKCRDKELLYCFGFQSILSFFNVAATFWCLTDSTASGSLLWEFSIRLGGALQVACCLWLIACCYRLFCGSGAVAWAPAPHKKHFPTAVKLSGYWEPQLPWNRRDLLYVAVPTLLCAVVSFINLGTTQVPSTTWQSSNTAAVELRFDASVEVSQIWAYSSIGDGFVEIWDDNNTDSPVATVETPFGNMYRWQVFELPFTAQHLTLRGYDASVNELIFVDASGNTLTPSYVTADGQALFDEQQLRPLRPSSYTGMYFDEIYHGRTAYEHMTGMAPYENSHPPLGKILIMLGIRAFGMNPFGWRFVGTLFGVLLLPLLYLIGRLLLGSREYALLGVTLLSLDFMRFTQSRIATIDTFAVFFILGAYYFMLHWLRQDILETPMRRQLIALGLSGLCFGLACSVKWVGVYAGVGLAVLFFLHLWEACQQQKILLQLICAGFGFFVAVPLTVYLLSYLPYFLCTAQPHNLSDVWGLQEFMLGYHGKLTDTHPFESRWYSWPFIGRPIWYSLGAYLPEGIVSSIALLGNPAVWWSGAAAMVFLAINKLRSHTWGGNRAEGFLIIAFLSQYLPWIFISRSTFLYHYFPSLPFIILALCLTLRQLVQRNKKLRLLPVLLVVVSLGLFVWFYPVLCDKPVTVEYAKSLLWFKDWNFYWLP